MNAQDFGDDEISKSQRKRDADAIRELGQRLAELGPSELATVPLPDDVITAIQQLHKLKANGARKRQIGFLAKRLRNAETSPIEAALEKIRQKARANTLNHHLVEQWRDRLLGEFPDESASDALTQFLHAHSTADRQQLRQLQRQALKERTMQKPPAASRQLFKTVRGIINAVPEGNFEDD
jgi:ribosome-associated protein